MSKAVEQLALALEIPDEPDDEKSGAVWNWWTATDEQKAVWTAEIEYWLNDQPTGQALQGAGCGPHRQASVPLTLELTRRRTQP